MQNPWQDIVTYPLGQRKGKPRDRGLTMVIDKGMGIDELRNLFEISGEYIDYLKLGFGTSVLYSKSLLADKLLLCNRYHVEAYPGGTLMEVAYIQGRFMAYLERAKELGFKTIEISDGTIHLDENIRQYCIKSSVKEGFTVLTEIGKKSPEESPHINDLLVLAEKDLAAGAWKVILEARESGKGIGAYDKNGQIIEEIIETISQNANVVDNIMWEAPLKNQQFELICRFGSEVNLGNIAPNEALSLEALRTGLRGDTLKLTQITERIPAQA